ncbi:cation:proton antiporter [Lacipirellula sp.]|uniref:cation:proton antiporter n=1 Tax=Lacipirellula sp. TaxID=2691419 RepID=UPI003D0EFC29
MHEEYALLISLSVSLIVALAFGLVTQKLKLSPIVGYLLAGFVLGPHTPGIEGDPAIALQFAEIGVALLMFGVGLHFDMRDLLAVKNIAIPGAVGQILVATALGAVGAIALGWPAAEAVVIGIAISVASTVVLIRVLTDNDVLHTSQGHIAVGWLLVEDIFTVLVLVVLPAVADILNDGGEVVGEAAKHAAGGGIAKALGMAVLRIGLLAALVLGAGKRLIPPLLNFVARTRSRELFTLCVLALALAIATGAFYLGVSIALGAFLAGMVVGQTEVSHQAAADALPMRDAFAVVFFVSVGMLFDPAVIRDQPVYLAVLLAIVLVAKPLTAIGIVWMLRYSFRNALTVGIALAQVGEFSFLLATEAIDHKLMTEEGRSLLVATAIISITLNPLIFRLIGPMEGWLRSRPKLWKVLGSRAEAGGLRLNEEMAERLAANGESSAPKTRAVIVGYGPVGQTAARILRGFGVETVVVDLNIDTIRELANHGQLGVYGDSTRHDILEAAGIKEAKYLLVTVPDVLVRTLVIISAKELNNELKVFARARYLKERAWLEEVGATQICIEEAETAVGLAKLLLSEVGADPERVACEVRRIQQELGVHRIEEDGFAPHYDVGI